VHELTRLQHLVSPSAEKCIPEGICFEKKLKFTCETVQKSPIIGRTFSANFKVIAMW